jgi:hypothetical protein
MIVRCGCGAAYEVKDEMAGKTLRCPKCTKEFVATAAASPPRPAVVAAASAAAPPAQLARTTSASAAERPQQLDREEREKQIIAQYVPYKPKPGSKLRGKALKQAEMKVERRERLGGFLRLMALAVGLIGAAIFGYFKLAQLDAGNADSTEVHWIMAHLYNIGGKWTASIGLGVIALGVIAYALLYYYGVVGRKREK